MIFYRTQSHAYNFVEVTMAGGGLGIVLRFYGSDASKAPVAVYFSLVKK